MNRYTILLVDDEKVIREGCRRAFATEGFRVVTAANGREALDVLAREPVHAILCDLKMPVMGAMVECMRKGAYDFVTKPFRVDDLILVVKRAISKLPPLQRFLTTSG
jgi:two-component system phosphate regulon sensor histidine kinase PhoR